ncbi:hypothetical protein BDN71DRAFT_1514253 [Pleurotus eryngii]|uniref:Uncharacterized protein n=1 Tax=Pleurotus eryngii TaxID=5323 RepID=A0A9P5ZHF0_PLEER|nr:hypothetical protein BDN71DRAFT_1514253 [Pleurotus eryngii]
MTPNHPHAAPRPVAQQQPGWTLRRPFPSRTQEWEQVAETQYSVLLLGLIWVDGAIWFEDAVCGKGSGLQGALGLWRWKAGMPLGMVRMMRGVGVCWSKVLLRWDSGWEALETGVAIPAGALKGVQFMCTPDYVQVVSFIDQRLINI